MRSHTITLPSDVHVHQRTCEDWPELLACAARVVQGAEGITFQGLPCASLDNQRLEWYGGVSLASAITLGWQGWPEGKTRLQNILKRIESLRLMPQAWRAGPVWDVAGEEPDVARFLEGSPENMMTITPQIQPHGKVLRLLVEGGYSSYRKPEHVLLRGAALLSAIHTAKMLGYTMDITLMFCVRTLDARENMEVTIPILRAGDVLDLDRLAFMTLHPCVLRRLMFAMCECESESMRRTFGFQSNDGYGIPYEHPHFPPSHDFYLDSVDTFPDSEEAAAGLAKRILAQCGIRLQEDSSPYAFGSTPV